MIRRTLGPLQALQLAECRVSVTNDALASWLNPIRLVVDTFVGDSAAHEHTMQVRSGEDESIDGIDSSRSSFGGRSVARSGNRTRTVAGLRTGGCQRTHW